MIWPKATDILLAAQFLREKVRHTPIEKSLDLSDIAGGSVYLKWENLQPCGSFKIRGALNKMFHMSRKSASGEWLRLLAAIMRRALP